MTDDITAPFGGTALGLDGRELATRGTTNRNARGSSYARKRRREWLVENFRSDVSLMLKYRPSDGMLFGVVLAADATDYARYEELPTCRCYRCGKLLAVEAVDRFEGVTVDRIIPGCRGGTYRRNNIRPACGACNSETGGALRSDR